MDLPDNLNLPWSPDAIKDGQGGDGRCGVLHRFLLSGLRHARACGSYPLVKRAVKYGFIDVLALLTKWRGGLDSGERSV